MTVRLNKPHSFPGMKELQAELNAIVLSLVPHCMDPSTESIPYMALGTDSAWTEVEYGYTVTSGDYVVEERPGRSEDEDSDAEDAGQAPEHSILRYAKSLKYILIYILNLAVRYRRLIFVQNQGFVQTEARLIPALPLPEPGGNVTEGAATVTHTKNQKKRMKKKIAEKKRLHARVDYVFDVDYFDAHHLAIIACLGSLPCTIPYRASEGSEAKVGADSLGILVGLGGGSLVMGLQHHYQFGNLLVCDLDDHMETLATKFFGFQKQRRTHVFAQEGVEFLGQIRHQADALSRDKIVGPTETTGDDTGMPCSLSYVPRTHNFVFG